MPKSKPVLDACCGGRMMWFDKADPRALFMDIRKESHQFTGGTRTVEINPDLLGTFEKMPFRRNSFSLVVFDPPHLTHAGKTGWMAKKYGRLTGPWREMIRSGFSECFRVLKTNGVLVFKWNELDVPVSEILKLSPVRPLFGNRSGKALKTHWIVFMKPAQSEEEDKV